MPNVEEAHASRSRNEEERLVLRELSERLEKACQTIEVLQERTNTLVRLLDMVGRRVDRLESRT